MKFFSAFKKVRAGLAALAKERAHRWPPSTSLMVTANVACGVCSVPGVGSLKRSKPEMGPSILHAARHMPQRHCETCA